MKSLILIVFISLTVVQTRNINSVIGVTNQLQGNDQKLITTTNNIFHQLKQEFEYGGTRYGGITAVINDYADSVFKNIQKFIVKHGLDPVELPNQILKLFPTGTISLSEGWLEDLSTIARYGNVSATYSASTKKLSLTVPLQFDTLMFIYQYHTKILLVDISGDTQGKITNIKANIELGFDFKTYQASVETFDIKDSGAISLTFSGNGLLDWVTSRMTDAVTFFLHPIIIRIIEYMVKGGVEDGVKAINEVVGSLLNNGTSTYDYLYI